MQRVIPAIALACLSGAAFGQTNSSRPPLQEVEKHVFDLVNQERTARGLHALEWDQRVAEAARSHSQRMAVRGFFSHFDPVRGDLAQRLNAAKIPWHQIAENLFTEKGFEDPAQRTVQSWMQSPGHRKNVLDKGRTRAGTGAARAPDGTLYVVEIYIRP